MSSVEERKRNTRLQLQRLEIRMARMEQQQEDFQILSTTRQEELNRRLDQLINDRIWIRRGLTGAFFSLVVGVLVASFKFLLTLVKK